MNEFHEPNWRDITARRLPTAEEQARLAAWLDAHPEELEPWQDEIRLTGLLRRLPDAPVASNFTAVVRREVERGAARVPSGRLVRPWRWVGALRFGWQLGAAAFALAMVLAVQHHRRVQARVELAESVATLPAVGLSDADLWKDFYHIVALPSTPPPSVDELAEAMK